MSADIEDVVRRVLLLRKVSAEYEGKWNEQISQLMALSGEATAAIINACQDDAVHMPEPLREDFSRIVAKTMKLVAEMQGTVTMAKASLGSIPTQ